MKGRINALIRNKEADPLYGGLLSASGTTVPADGAAGYLTGCIFHHIDGGAGTAFYVNEGSMTSSAFAAVAGLTAAQEALLGATAGTATASTAVILDANAAIDAVKTAALSVGVSGSELPVVLADMTAGTGISTGTGTICEHSVTKVGGLFLTQIFVDLTGLNGCGAAGDVIGKDGDTANCHIGQIVAAVNGTIVGGRVTCLEAPAGGNVDVDLWSADEDTLAQDTAISAATAEVQLINHGAWAADEVGSTDGIPVADQYLYLTAGANTDADFTAGILMIELWGK